MILPSQEHSADDDKQVGRAGAHSSYSRRAFLERATALGAVLGLPSLLTACGGEGGETSGETAAAEDVQASECAGYDTLTEAQLQTRQALGYVDDSPYPVQLCNNCQFYNQPEGDSPCGGCQLFAGPVAPEGYCNSWVAATEADAPVAPADSAV